MLHYAASKYALAIPVHYVPNDSLHPIQTVSLFYPLQTRRESTLHRAWSHESADSSSDLIPVVILLKPPHVTSCDPLSLSGKQNLKGYDGGV
jgi:hypothetical protein